MYKSLDKRQHLWHDIVLKSNEEYKDSCHCITWSGSRLRDRRKWKHIFWARRIKLWNSLTQFRKATGFKTRFLIVMEKSSYLREWTTWNLLAQEVLKTTKDRIQESLWNIDLISYSVCLSSWTPATIRERDIRKMDYWAELLWQLRGPGHGKLFYVATVETCKAQSLNWCLAEPYLQLVKERLHIWIITYKEESKHSQTTSLPASLVLPRSLLKYH